MAAEPCNVPDGYAELRRLLFSIKVAEPIAADRLQRGSKVAVAGQLVQREYEGKTYLDVKNSRVTYLDSRQENTGGGDAF